MDFYCCSYKREKTFVKKNPKIQRAPEILKCAENLCSNVIPKTSIDQWRCAISGKYLYRFCSDECWTTWLKDATPNKSIIQFGSPNTPAIQPHERQTELPLLNI